jgi:hypothetical protein
MIRNAQVGQQVIVDCDGGLLVEGVIRDIWSLAKPWVVFVQLKGEEQWTETTRQYLYTIDAGLRLALQRAADLPPPW